MKNYLKHKLALLLAALYGPAPPEKPDGPVSGTFALLMVWHLGQGRPPRKVMTLKIRCGASWHEHHVELSGGNLLSPN